MHHRLFPFNDSMVGQTDGPASRLSRGYGSRRQSHHVNPTRQIRIAHACVAESACSEVDAAHVNGTFVEPCYSCRIDCVKGSRHSSWLAKPDFICPELSACGQPLAETCWRHHSARKPSDAPACISRSSVVASSRCAISRRKTDAASPFVVCMHRSVCPDSRLHKDGL